MAFFRIFPNVRSTAPDLATLQATLRTALNDATVIIYAAIGDGFLAGKDGADWSATDIATGQSTIDAAPAVTAQSLVKAYLDAQPLVERARDLTMLDQINLIRSKLVPALGAVTPAQLLNAIKNKVDALIP